MSLSKETILPALTQLPENYWVQLTELAAITLSGKDKSSYLQGQVSCDVNQLNDNSLIHGAHCDAKGKMYSVFRLFNRHNSHWLLQPQVTISASIAALQKFGVFANVDIKKAEQCAFYGLIGQQAEKLLKQHFQQIPDSMSPVVQCNTTTLLFIAGTNYQENHRYILIDQASALEALVAQFSLPIFTQPVWDLHEIISGFPLMNETAIGEYVPQMLNVQAINGISFTKGCYLGQETIARMQYLGRNKRALFILTGTVNTDIATDDIIERQLGENWRRAGNILSYYQADDGTSYIQTVLASDLIETTKFRLKKQPQATFTLLELPYSLTSQDIDA